MARFLPPGIGRYRVTLRVADRLFNVDRATLIEFLPRLEDTLHIRRGHADFDFVFPRSHSILTRRVEVHDMVHACGMLAEALEEGERGLEGVTMALAQKLDQRLEQDCETGHGDPRRNSIFHRTRKMIICLAENSKILDSFPLASILHSFFQKNSAKIMNYEHSPRAVGEWVMAIQYSRMNDNQLVLSYRELLKERDDLPRLLRNEFIYKDERERDAISSIIELAQRMDETGDHVGLYGARPRPRLDRGPIPGMVRPLPRPLLLRDNSFGEYRHRRPRPGPRRYGSNGETAMKIHQLEREIDNLRENVDGALAAVNDRVDYIADDATMPRAYGPALVGYGDDGEYLEEYMDEEEYNVGRPGYPGYVMV